MKLRTLFSKKQAKKPPPTPDEIRELLNSEEDEEAERLGLLLASQNRPEEYLEEASGVAHRAITPIMRQSWMNYVATLPTESIVHLLNSENRSVRARTLMAITAHQIPVGIPPISRALHDDDRWVRLMACAAAYQLGMGKLAEVTWRTLPLSSFNDRGLLQFIEPLSKPHASFLKQLAHFTSPRVREAAIVKMGEHLSDFSDPDLLETGLSSITHDNPDIRAAGVWLLKAAAPDNAADYIAALLSDLSEKVRQNAAKALNQFQPSAAEPYLHSERFEVVEAAILAYPTGGERLLRREIHTAAHLEQVHPTITLNAIERVKRIASLLGKEIKPPKPHKPFDLADPWVLRYKEGEMNRLLFLKQIPYFEGLLLEELLIIDEKLVEEEYLQGEVIFEEGAPGDRFYIVYEGKVDLTAHGQPIASVEPGGHFAEMALFEDAPRSATATAASDTTLLALEKQAFNSLVIQRPQILLQICRELSHRIRDLNRQNADLGGAK